MVGVARKEGGRRKGEGGRGECERGWYHWILRMSVGYECALKGACMVICLECREALGESSLWRLDII